MTNPYKPTTEIDERDPPEIPGRRPTVFTIAAIIFVTIGGATLLSGSLIEGTGALVVAFACWAGGAGGVDH
ncbi:hypothetical protein [Neorhodopirellula lusitana]|uniref:hypothetical protein n=1 Tax=Neorhodopirellula lusitana TaxID=445327 RepID=UPI0024B7B5D4|nr:hypothetical protein [Neorhodopirellula lusitana]